MLDKLPSDYFKETNSDKTSAQHNYGMLYDLIVEWLLMRNEKIKVLEVGCSLFGIRITCLLYTSPSPRDS